MTGMTGNLPGDDSQILDQSIAGLLDDFAALAAELYDQADRAVVARDAVLSTLIREIATPLTVIQGRAQLLVRRQLVGGSGIEDEVVAHLQQILQASRTIVRHLESARGQYLPRLPERSDPSGERQ